MRKERIKHLAIGSVVGIKDLKTKLMIVGFCPIKDQQVYDYIGVLYPEGISTTRDKIFFNYSQIEDVYHYGYVNEEEKEYMKKMLGLLKRI